MPNFVQRNFISRKKPLDMYDFIIRGGNVYDGSGGNPIEADVGILNGKLRILQSGQGEAKQEIDAKGLAVSPGFVNKLSWSVESLIEDGRALGTIRQGVTLEVMGEGWSWGPLSEELKEAVHEVFSSPIQYDVTWDTLGEYLQFLEDRGIATNVASFVGATTIRTYVLGHENRKPTDEEMERMKKLVRQAMEEGALGVGSSLIYPPAFYASTEELIELCKVVAEFGGMYISHIRSEGANLLEALDEFFTIVRKSGVKGEVYHLKAAGKSNWEKLDEVIKRIEEEREKGLPVTTNMYLYTAAGTGLSSTLPPWAEEGGQERFIERLSNPETRAKLKQIMAEPTDEWENLYVEAGPENIMISAVANDKLRPLIGKRIADIAKERGQDPRDTIIDLLIEDNSRIGTIYFLMSEENVRKKIKLPFMSFGSDAASMSAEGIFLKNSAHPRAYGNFVRLIGKYVREGVLTLQEAIRRLSSLPCQTLGISKRGLLRDDYFADVVVFDPAEVRDNSTYENPHQLAAGVIHVWVNGEQVLRDGEHTGRTPGKFIRKG